MRLGVIARSEDRGLGIMLWELCRALRPASVLLVDMGPLARGFPMYPARYPGATVVTYDDGTLPEAEVRRWLRGLDVVYTAETFYDWRIPLWAEEAGVATVCHVMPEFHVERPGLPTRWWAPTTWRLDSLPEGARVVPVPVADDRFAFRPSPPGARLRLLHSAGHRAMGDRNGTAATCEALRRVRGPLEVTLACQDARMVAPRLGTRRGVVVRARTGGHADYWAAYEGHDALVLPRRYGGLCLPVQEAMAAGLAVVMTDAEPQSSTWPVRLVPSRRGRPMRMPAGQVVPVDADTVRLARAIDALADPATLAALKEGSVEWALEHRWSVLRPLYEAELADACR